MGLVLLGLARRAPDEPGQVRVRGDSRAVLRGGRSARRCALAPLVTDGAAERQSIRGTAGQALSLFRDGLSIGSVLGTW